MWQRAWHKGAVTLLAMAFVIGGCSAASSSPPAASTAVAPTTAVPTTGASTAPTVAAATAAVAPPSPAKQLALALIVANLGDGFYQKCHAGAVSEAAKLGVKLVYEGPTVYDASAQAAVVDTTLALHPDGLAIATFPSVAQTDLQRWVAAGIPIDIFDSVLPSGITLPVISSVLSDNVGGGKMAADEMATLIGSKGQVAIIDLETSDLTLTNRRDGFVNEIDAKYPNIQVVAYEMTGTDFPSAATIAQSLLTRYPNLKGIFTTYSFATDYVGKVIQDDQLQNKVVQIGFEAGAQEIALVKSGAVKAVIAQQPALECQQSLDNLYNYLTGQKDKVQATYALPDMLITKDNVDQSTQYYYQP